MTKGKITRYMMNKFQSLIAIIVMITISSSSGFSAIRTLKDGERVELIISNKWPTKLGFENARITDIYGEGNTLKIEPNEESGEIKLSPQEDAKNPVKFSITDSNGNSYEFLTIFKEIPPKKMVYRSDSIDTTEVIAEKDRKASKVENQTVRNIMIALENRNKNAGRWITPESKVFRIANCKVKLIKILSNSKAIGEIYRVKNTSGESLTLEEVQFYIIGENVLGVGIRNRTLKNGEETLLYIVRAKGGISR